MSCASYQLDQLQNATGQPEIMAFQAFDCQGISQKISIGDHPAILGEVNGMVISSLWLPPNITGKLYPILSQFNTWDESKAVNVGINTNIYKNLFETLNYQPVLSAKFEQTKTWDEFKLDCCKGIPSSSPALCGDYWRANSEKNTGSCDRIISDYCVSNPTDKLCSCQFNNMKTGNDEYSRHLDQNPVCRGDCVQYGYKTQSMKNISCPPIVICNQNVNVNYSERATIKDNIITAKQNCPGETSQQANTSSGVNVPYNNELYSDGGVSDEELPAQESDNNDTVVIIFVLLFIIIVVTVVITVMLNNNSTQQPQYQYYY